MKKHLLFYSIALILSASCLYAQSVEKENLWEKFKNDYSGNFFIQWDEKSGGPKQIVGSEIFLSAHSIDKSNIERITKEFVLKYQDLFNFRGSELRLDRVVEIEKKFIVSFKQYYKDVPLWNIKMKLKIADNGQVLKIKSPLYSFLQISTQPSIQLEQALQSAESALNIAIDNKSKEGKLVIYPDRETGRLFLCWHVQVINKNIKKGVMVDAMTGKTIYFYDLYRNEEIRGTVQIGTWSLPGEASGSPDATYNCISFWFRQRCYKFFRIL